MTLRLTSITLLVSLAGCTAAEAQGIPDDFSVTVTRTPCFGSCPVYSVTIDARGNVSYQGDAFVRVTGRQTSKVALDRVEKLVQAVEQIDFFNRQAAYREKRNADGTITFVTDLPTTYISVTSNGRKKRIEDYYGTPKELRDFSLLVDEVAATRQWIRIDGATLHALLKWPKRPSADALSNFLLDAIDNDDVDVVQVLFDHGVDVTRRYTRDPLLHRARSPRMVNLLKQGGADVDARTNEGTALMHAVYFGAELTKALLDAGVPADVPGTNGFTPLLSAACVGNAGAVELLLGAGADPESRGGNNRISPLECAQQLRNQTRWRSDFSLFDEDPAAVIKLLEAAIAKRKPQ
jgi:hypothetical protein